MIERYHILFEFKLVNGSNHSVKMADVAGFSEQSSGVMPMQSFRSGVLVKARDSISQCDSCEDYAELRERYVSMVIENDQLIDSRMPALFGSLK